MGKHPEASVSFSMCANACCERMSVYEDTLVRRLGRYIEGAFCVQLGWRPLCLKFSNVVARSAESLGTL